MVDSLKIDLLSLQILGFETVPDFTVIFKSYTKCLKENMNIYLQTIGSQIYKDENTFYLDSSSLVTSKLDKEAKFGKSTRLGWYSGYKLHLICNRPTGRLLVILMHKVERLLPAHQRLRLMAQLLKRLQRIPIHSIALL